MPEVVLVGLLGHGDDHDDHQRHQPGQRVDGRVLQHQGQQQIAEEVEVGRAPELLEQVERDEGQQGVLGRVDAVVLKNNSKVKATD